MFVPPKSTDDSLLRALIHEIAGSQDLGRFGVVSEAARRLKVSRATVYRWLQFRAVPESVHALRILDALQLARTVRGKRGADVVTIDDLRAIVGGSTFPDLDPADFGPML